MKSQSSNPYNSVCTVTVSLDHSNDEKHEGSCSGILIDAKQGLILTHASLVYQLAHKLRPGKLEALRRTGSIKEPIFDEKIIIDVVLPNNTDVLVQNKHETDIRIYPSLLNGNAHNVQNFSKHRASLKMIFECRNLRRTIEQTLPGETWQFVDETSNTLSEKDDYNQQNKTINNEDVNFYLLPSFLLIQLKDYQPCNRSLLIRPSRLNRQGDLVEICATPFGGLSPEVFLNSRSRGIISNLAGPRGVLIMTDARCVPGSEGGALFYCINGQRHLAGIMIASLCWKNSEWVGLSMACAMSELMGRLDGYITLEEEEEVQPLYRSGLGSSFIDDLAQTLMYVHVGPNWGTAVCVDPEQGIYLTCSHVMAGVETYGVTVSSHLNKRKHVCDLVYRVPQAALFDLALLRLRDIKAMTLPNVPVRFGKAVEGEVVYVIGHAIFKSDLDLPPMVTRGTVSKILRHNNIPVMIQTTCAVHAGVSGGGVFNQHGQLVAIVVCNSKDTQSGACYPHVNMCVPVEIIAPVIQQYLLTKDGSVLKNLHITNKQLKQLWSIGNDAKAISHL